MRIEPGTSPKHRYELIKATLLVIVGALITITIVYGIEYFTPKPESTSLSTEILPSDEATTITKNQPTDQPKKYSQEELNKIFEMDKKKPGTKLFYSEKLGVGFTYAPTAEPSLTLSNVRELGNKIYLTDGTESPNSNPSAWTGHRLEIFNKDFKDTLEQAITKEFLAEANPNDCFAVSYNDNRSLYNETAGIRYKEDPNSSNDTPFWENSKYCPTKAQGYTETNGIQYFISDKNNPNSSYGFLGIGNGAQDASAGYKDNNLSWYDTIRFLK